MIYKLKYASKDKAIADLKAKDILVENDKGELINGDGIVAIVEIGKIMDKPPIYENGEIKTDATYIDGYHYDIMADKEIYFVNEIQVNNPKHIFAN